MQLPISSPAHGRLAAGMLERACDLPKGGRFALVTVDGTVFCCANDEPSRKENLLILQRHLAKRGIEPVALRVSPEGDAWVLIGVMPPPGGKLRAIEESIEQFLKRGRRRGRSKKTRGRE